jgi:hypothetical protein
MQRMLAAEGRKAKEAETGYHGRMAVMAIGRIERPS